MKLSVIVPAYNEERYLPATLACIERARACVRESELIVVDNDSGDRTPTIAASAGARVVHAAQHNVSHVRNVGAHASTGDVFVFIDADTLIPETLLENIATSMEDPRCLGGAVAVEYADVRHVWTRLYLWVWQGLAILFRLRQGAAQFCRRSAFDALRGYDESLFMGEDVDFHWRLSRLAKKDGGALRFITGLKVGTSSRRFHRTGLLKTLFFTHPVIIYLNRRRPTFWKDWYETPIR